MTDIVRGAVGTALVLSLGTVIFPTVGAAWITTLIVAGSIIYICLGKGPPGRYLRALDAVLYAGERWIVCTALVVMSTTVFCDVVWSTAHDMDAGAAKGMLGGIFVLCVGGGMTSRTPQLDSVPKRLGAGLLAFVVMMLAGWAIMRVPNGFGWSQRLALALMLWVGLLGGSMATRQGRHIAVDAVRRVVPPNLVRRFELAAGLATVAVTGALTLLAVGYVRANWVEWVSSEMTAGVFESIPIPYWSATLAIPIGFGLMTARFLDAALHGQAKADLIASLGGAKEIPDDEPGDDRGDAS